jgi:hypothetical protein
MGKGYHFAKLLNTEDMSEFLLKANLSRHPDCWINQIERKIMSNKSSELNLFS